MRFGVRETCASREGWRSPVFRRAQRFLGHIPFYHCIIFEDPQDVFIRFAAATGPRSCLSCGRSKALVSTDRFDDAGGYRE